MAKVVKLNLLRRAVREMMAGSSYRLAAEQIDGVSTATLHRFMSGSEPDFKTFVGLLEFARVDAGEVIVDGGKQLSLMRDVPAEA